MRPLISPSFLAERYEIPLSKLPSLAKAKRDVIAAQRRLLNAKTEIAAAEKQMRDAQITFDAVVCK